MMHAEDEAFMLTKSVTSEPRLRNASGARNVSKSHNDWLGKTMSLARFAQNTCSVCQVYVDKQVEFENRLEAFRKSDNRHQSPSVSGKFWSYAANNAEVELYRQFLFDEESVVQGLCARSEDEDDHEKENVQNTKSQRVQPAPSNDDDEIQSFVTQRTH